MRTLARLRDGVVGMRACREVGRVLQTYLDGDLDPAQVVTVAAHLDTCRRCGMEAEAYSRIKESLARVGRDGRVHPEDRLSIERLRRFAESLQP